MKKADIVTLVIGLALTGSGLWLPDKPEIWAIIMGSILIGTATGDLAKKLFE